MFLNSNIHEKMIIGGMFYCLRLIVKNKCYKNKKVIEYDKNK